MTYTGEGSYGHLKEQNDVLFYNHPDKQLTRHVPEQVQFCDSASIFA